MIATYPKFHFVGEKGTEEVIGSGRVGSGRVGSGRVGSGRILNLDI